MARLNDWASEEAGGYLSEAQDYLRNASRALKKRKCAIAKRALTKARDALIDAGHTDPMGASSDRRRRLNRAGSVLAIRLSKMKQAHKCVKGG